MPAQINWAELSGPPSVPHALLGAHSGRFRVLWLTSQESHDTSDSLALSPH